MDCVGISALYQSLSVNCEFCSAALQSGCRAGLQTCTHRLWRLGSRQYSRSGDRRYNLAGFPGPKIRTWDTQRFYDSVNSQLLGQYQRALDLKALREHLSAGFRLAAADREGVLALGDDRLSGFRDHAQVARLKLEAQLLRGACFQMNPLEAAQCTERRARYLGKFKVELSDFIAGALAGVGDGEFGDNRAARSQRS